MRSNPRLSSSFILGALSILSVFSVAACKKDTGESAGVTTIRSGSPEGVRVTNASPGGALPEAASRFAGALCKHERECAEARSRQSEEAILLEEAACVSELKPTAEVSFRELSCSPAVARAGFEECLAAVKSERCYDTMARFPQVVPACRPTEVCRRGEAITQR
jgi:hypothetical protein